jgi:2'-5' RNA ligase
VKARLFFALWPDGLAAGGLAALARELAALSGGKPVPVPKIHLTLAFLGDLEEARIADAMRAAEAGSWPAFEMSLDSVGSFRGARVAWAGCEKTPAALASLQSGLARLLADSGFAPDSRPYTPHVTLARKITRPVQPAAVDAIRWRATRIALVRSELGKGSYATLGTWPLTD